MPEPDRQSDHDRIEKEEQKRKEEAEKERPKVTGHTRWQVMKERIESSDESAGTKEAARMMMVAYCQGYKLALEDMLSWEERQKSPPKDYQHNTSYRAGWRVGRAKLLGEARRALNETRKTLSILVDDAVEERPAEKPGGTL